MLRPGALGDTLLAVPALRALGVRFGRITLAAHGPAARLLQDLGEVHRGMSFDDPFVGGVLSGRVSDFGPVVAWMRTPLPGALLVAPAQPVGDVHCARHLVETLAALGIEPSVDQRPLTMRAHVTEEVLVHPGSGSPVKNWPAERFAESIAALDQPVRLIVGEADDASARKVEQVLGRMLPHIEQPSLSELAAALAGCAAYLGNDSGVSHLAGLCGARTVALFGPTDPRVWRPLGPNVHVLPFDSSPRDVLAALTA